MIKKLIHKAEHILSINHGMVHSELRGHDIWIGFKCGKCGKIEGMHCVNKVIDRLLKEK